MSILLCYASTAMKSHFTMTACLKNNRISGFSMTSGTAGNVMRDMTFRSVAGPWMSFWLIMLIGDVDL